MFELPDAKRIRREDLYDSTSDEESAQVDQFDPALQQKLNEQLSGLLDLSFAADENIETHKTPESFESQAGEEKGILDDEKSKEPEEETFTFRLFRDEDPSHKVVLESQASADKIGDGAFITAKRPMSYYLATDLSPTITEQFKMAAVSAEYLREDAKKRRWGLEKPWKVTTITITTNKRTPVTDSRTNCDSAVESKKRKRPGKKRRIVLRVREKAKKEREETMKQQLVDKEEHLKEKKKRLNRQKKLKRRAKEREKKQGTQGDAISDAGSRDSSPDKEED